MASPFHVLDLVQTATISDVKQRYRKLVLIYHPDKNSQGHDHFTSIQNAYEVLLKIAPEKSPPAVLQSRDQLWPADEDEPSFDRVAGLCKHLRIDALDGVHGHDELVDLLAKQDREAYQQYTQLVGMVLSKVQCECSVLEKRCMSLNGNLHLETEMWRENAKLVKDLQYDLTTLLTSLHVMWDESEEIKGLLRGNPTLSGDEWKCIVEMLKGMAHCL